MPELEASIELWPLTILKHVEVRQQARYRLRSIPDEGLT